MQLIGGGYASGRVTNCIAHHLFDDGTFGAVTALPKFITTVLREGRGISALIYRQINTPPDAAAAAEKAVAC